MPVPKNKPRLVNRGGAGLYGKLKPQDKAKLTTPDAPTKPKLTVSKAKYQIAPGIARLAVDINSVTYDPDNARLHPEANIEALKESLTTYGQVKPIVVQASTRHVVAGNGTLRCARELGWKQIAAVIVEMTDAEAAGYGLADNKTAELAKWDFESDVLKRLEKKIGDSGLPMTGWSENELVVIRNADLWTPPEQTDEDFEDETNVKIVCTQEEYELIEIALNMVRERSGNKKKNNPERLTDGACIKVICEEWFPKPSYERNGDADSEAE